MSKAITTNHRVGIPLRLILRGLGIVFSIILPHSLAAQGSISTVAGSPWIFPAFVIGGPATTAPLGYVRGVATDPAGNLYLADPNNNFVAKISSSGTFTIVAGTGVRGFSGDGGAAVNAKLFFPEYLAYDSAGNLYIADSGNNRIRKIDANGIITTVAGNGSGVSSGDGGAATSAGVASPGSIALDGSGNLFIVDASQGNIRKVDTAGNISTLAITGGYSKYLAAEGVRRRAMDLQWIWDSHRGSRWMEPVTFIFRMAERGLARLARQGSLQRSLELLIMGYREIADRQRQRC